MRTGSVGNRSADDIVNTLPKEKKQVISSVRKLLLDRGLLEDVEYDSINIEPVLKYSKSESDVVFLRHKWELTAMIPVQAPQMITYAEKIFKEKISEYLFIDENGNRWIKFNLPEAEEELRRVMDELFTA